MIGLEGSKDAPAPLKRARNLRSVQTLSVPVNSGDPREFGDLIGIVYDAAIDPSRWEEAIARTARFVGGTDDGHPARGEEGLQRFHRVISMFHEKKACVQGRPSVF